MPIIRRASLKGNQEQRDAAAARRLEERKLLKAFAAVFVGDKQHHAPVLDALSHRLLLPMHEQRGKCSLPAHVRLDMLLTLILRRPDFLSRFQQGALKQD